MSASVVEAHSSSLFGCLQSAYWNGSNFQSFKPYVERLAGCLTEYSDKLSSQNKKVKKNHHSPVPVRQLSESLSVSIIKQSGMSYPCYDKLVQILSNLDSNEHTCLSDISPDQSRERNTFINNLKSELNIPVVMLTYSPGNNCGNLTFLWKYGDNDSVETVFEKSVSVVEVIKPLLPQYHTRAMKCALFAKFGQVMHGIRYEREFLLKFRDQSTFVFLDDKHRVKVGDPGEPLAATKRGRRVIIPGNCSFEVSDHDFSKFSLIPSVFLLVDIPSASFMDPVISRAL